MSLAIEAIVPRSMIVPVRTPLYSFSGLTAGGKQIERRESGIVKKWKNHLLPGEINALLWRLPKTLLPPTHTNSCQVVRPGYAIVIGLHDHHVVILSGLPKKVTYVPIRVQYFDVLCALVL